ncbi:MAG: D-lyxose/D-mannose family sugar isomerase [Opitutaceae bacterium]|jgi:D-lyxose ketol-isomerase|nr:D-lyxose/D-mannose family sugar isomerase [Opitutaceae bacterium]
MLSAFLTPRGHDPLSRSTINASIRVSREVLERLGIHLPAFAGWTPARWENTGPEADEIRDCALGWDVTDFGSRKFHELGRTLFTMRNGLPLHKDARYPKPYAEKFLIEPENQRSPIHYHLNKREDIINRGGGNVIVALHRIGQDGMPDARGAAINASVDGVRRTFAAGEKIRLRPGESIAIPPSTFHQFWAEEGTGLRIDGVGYTVSGEISTVCDDYNDNCFIDDWSARYPEIVEDEPRETYLCNEYPRATLKSAASPAREMAAN